jgi:hypothetical protein
MEILDNMRITAKSSEDWQTYFDDLCYEGFPLNHPEIAIATNGILMAPRKADLERQEKKNRAITDFFRRVVTFFKVKDPVFV